jgi:hypothetical protein
MKASNSKLFQIRQFPAPQNAENSKENGQSRTLKGNQRGRNPQRIPDPM